MSARQRKLSVVTGVLLVLGLAVAAWAYLTAFGTGSGDALATTLDSAAPVTASASGTGATVSWSAVSSPSGTASDVSYSVSRSTDGSTWTAASGTCAGALSSGTTSCTDAPASTGDYFYRVIAAFRSWTSSAQTSSATHVTVCVTATKLVFTSSPQTLAAGGVSGVITIQRQDASGATGTCGSTTVDLSTSSGAGSFRDSANTQTITSVVIAAGSSSASFRYTDTVVGTPTITAADHAGVLTQTTQSETVTAGTAATVRVETAANGSGTVVPAQSVTAGSSITVYSVSRDTFGNFVANVAADAWSLPTKTGGVANGDLVAASDAKSATFTGHLVGTATIRATSGVLSTTDSGTITVVAGTATQIRVETAANGTGTVVPAQNVGAGSSITVYSISRDGQGNFLANTATDAAGWSLTSKTGGVVDGDLVAAGDLKSAIFTGHAFGTAKIHAVKSSLTSTDSGTLTVVAGAGAKYTFTTTAQTLTAGNTSTVLSGTITVQLQDAGGNPTNATSDTVVSLSSSAAGGVFRNAADSATITSITMTTGTNSVSFKYRSTLAGSNTLTAHTTGLTDGTQTEFVNSAPVALTWNCPTGTVAKGQTSTVTISVPTDAFGNAFTRNAALVVTVSLSVNDNLQYTVNGSTSSTTVSITTGPANNTFTLVTATGANKNATVHASVGSSFTAPADAVMKTGN